MKPKPIYLEQPLEPLFGVTLRHCLASLFELHIEQVPWFAHERPAQPFLDDLFAFLKPLGFYPLILEFSRGERGEYLDYSRGNMILIGHREGKPLPQCVICTGRGAIVFDPDQSEGKFKPFDYEWSVIFVVKLL